MQDVMTLSDSDDVQTISSGSDDNKEREKKTQGKGNKPFTLTHGKGPPNYLFVCFASKYTLICVHLLE